MESAWAVHSKVILSSLLNSDAQQLRMYTATSKLKPEDFFPLNGSAILYAALLEIANLGPSGKIPTPELVYSTCGKAVELSKIKEIASEEHSPEERAQSTELVRDYGARYRLKREIKEIEKRLLDVDIPLREIQAHAVESFSKTGPSSQTPRSIGAVLERHKQNKTRKKPTSTNNQWFDYILAGGWQPGTIVVIAGAEKSGKTTTARQLVRETLRYADADGKPAPRPRVKVMFCAFENDAEITTMDFVAMTAAEIFVSMYPNLINERYKERYYHEWLNSALITSAQAEDTFDKWPDALKDCIDKAERYITKYLDQSLYIYDETEEGGNLQSLDNLIVAIEEFCATHDEENHRIIVVDYLGLVDVPRATEYEAQRKVVNALKKVAVRQNATIILLAQINRTGQKDGEKRKSSDVISTHGGPEAERASVAYFQVKQSPDGQGVLIRLARARRASTKGMHKKFFTHPSSGAFLKKLVHFKLSQEEIEDEQDSSSSAGNYFKAK